MGKVSIEVGHGGKDVGAINAHTTESAINLTVALELKRQLERHGVQVLISRTTDCDDRARDFFPRAREFAPDVGVSVHTNAFNGQAYGFEVFHSKGLYKAASVKLCQAIEAEVQKVGQHCRGIKESPFLLSSLPCPTAYLELGFMDNPDCFKRYDTVEKQKAFATAYAKGILAFLGIAWVEELTETEGVQEKEKQLFYRCFAGSFTDKANAERQAEKLRKQGFACFLETAWL